MQTNDLNALRDRSHAHYDAMSERMNDAWRNGAPKEQDVPTIAKDGRAFADLAPQEQAHERMAAGPQDAWKAA